MKNGVISQCLPRFLVQSPPALSSSFRNNFVASVPRCSIIQWASICNSVLDREGNVFLALRSQPQAEALNRALTNDKSMSLGDFICRLRIEGGFGRCMSLLKHCRNIDHIFLNLDVKSTDNVTVMAQELPKLRVLHLVVAAGDSLKNNRQTRTMGEALTECVRGKNPRWPLVMV